jgi:hypothetical protein
MYSIHREIIKVNFEEILAKQFFIYVFSPACMLTTATIYYRQIHGFTCPGCGLDLTVYL